MSFLLGLVRASVYQSVIRLYKAIVAENSCNNLQLDGFQ